MGELEQGQGLGILGPLASDGCGLATGQALS